MKAPAAVPEPCPECRAGKCRHCDGQTWDVDRDEPAICPCWVDHKPREGG